MPPTSPYLKARDLKIPPHNIEAEKALLGSIMIRPDVMHDVMDVINAQTFYSNQNRAIWTVIAELHLKTAPIDLLSVSARLKEHGTLEDSGGMAYLSEIINSVHSSVNASHYAEIVEKKYVMRELLRVAEQITGFGYDEESDLHELLENVFA